MKQPLRSRHRKFARGLTLMEAVIAIGVIAFAVPLILAATNNGTRTRRNAEADTRSAWIVNELQRQLTESWRGIPSPALTPAPQFPTFASVAAPLVFHYDNDGRFLQVGTVNELERGSKVARSVYLVTMFGAAQAPNNFLDSTSQEMSLVSMQVQFPSQSPLGKRQISPYTVLIPRQTQP